MKFSILLPSRNNFDNLKIVISSYLDTANSQENVEIMVGIDIDDDQFDNIKNEYENIDNVKILEFAERYGYKNLHKYTNILAEHSSGEFLGVGSDDLVMLTDDWDLKIESDVSGGIHIINPTTIWIPEKGEIRTVKDILFPFFSRKMFDVLGRISESCHVDSWIGRIYGFVLSNNLNILAQSDVTLQHDMKDMYGGRRNNNVGDSERFFTQLEVMESDANKMIDYLKNYE
jgi:hypothetical protein